MHRTMTVGRLIRMPGAMSDQYQRAISEISRRSAASSGFVADPFLDESALERGLLRTRALFDALQSPDKHLRIIHVAGSKGKGSTATFLANMLTDAGKRTGLTTSPHFHTYRERMTINGQTITPDDFARVARPVLDAASRIEEMRPELGQVSAFETLIGMSLVYFVDEVCDFAVVEVGLGGRFDATNVLSPAVCVITTLELEHTEILGASLQEIAWNKGGIIKPGLPVVSSSQPPEALLVLEDIAGSREARLLVGGRDWRWRGTSADFTFANGQGIIKHLAIQMPGAQQVENATTAVATVSQLAGKGLPPDPDAIRSGLGRTALPGRFETVEFQGRRIVLDGAHTPGSARLLVEALREIGIDDPVVIAGFLKDKDITTLVQILGSISGRLLLAPVDSPRGATVAELTLVAAETAGETTAVFPAISPVKS